MSFIGKLHPLLVHLPIGFLLIGLILYWWQQLNPSKNFSSATSAIFFFGAAGAIISCLTGLQLMNTGDYDPVTVTRHRNTGLLVAVISIYFWYLEQKNENVLRKNFLSVSLFLVLIITGHYGGTLTHGGDYLSFSSKADIEETPVVIANMEEAIIFNDLIRPVLKTKCFSCHGQEKMKGNLRLDEESFILKGGKHGSAVTVSTGNALLLQRILLPPDDEEHMPPKEKGQLTPDEVQLIRWWLEGGGNFTIKVKEQKKDEQITALLNRLQQKVVPTVKVNETEIFAEVKPADQEVISILRNAGISVAPISKVSNLLQLNLLNLTDSTVDLWSYIQKLSPQIISIQADRSFVTDQHIEKLGSCFQLRKLSISGANITDKAIESILQLPLLSSLNVNGTNVTIKGLKKLKANTALRYLYVVGVSDTTGIRDLENELRSAIVLSKMYSVPTLVSDTTIVMETK